MIARLSIGVLFVSSLLPGQIIRSLRLHSEFQRIDPFGRTIAADRSTKPREIISPGVARNAWFTVRFSVTADPRTTYFLAFQANPPDVFRWKVYQEIYVRRGDQWIPDGLKEQHPPYFSVMPDPDAAVPGQTTQSFLLDMFIPRETPADGVRLEVLAKSASWLVCPMEVRILPVIIPTVTITGRTETLPSVEQPADAATTGSAPASPAEQLTVRGLIRRNALQDQALSRTLESSAGTKVCRDAAADRDTPGAESYLRFRDCLYREAQRKAPR